MILYLNADDSSPSFNKKDYLLRAAVRLGFEDKVKDYAERENDAVELVLNIQPCGLMRGTVWTGLWHIDILLNSGLAQRYGEMDTTFVSSNQMLIPYENAQVLFQAADTELHRRLPEIKQEFDFVLCGSIGGPYHERRERIANVLKEHFTYSDAKKGHPPDRYIRELNRGKVQWICSGEGPAEKGALAQRFFESLPIGPVLVSWSDDICLTGLEENRDFMTYRGPEEAISKMKRLLEDKELSKRITRNGREKALLYHTYEHRLISIINTINEFTNSTTL